MENKCMICGREATVRNIGADALLFKCSSCGEIAIAGRVQTALLKEPQEVLSKLSRLLAEHRLESNDKLFLVGGGEGRQKDFLLVDYKELLKHYPRDTAEILDRSLLNLSRMVSHPSHEIQITEDLKEVFFAENGMPYYTFAVSLQIGDS